MVVIPESIEDIGPSIIYRSPNFQFESANQFLEVLLDYSPLTLINALGSIEFQLPNVADRAKYYHIAYTISPVYRLLNTVSGVPVANTANLIYWNSAAPPIRYDGRVLQNNFTNKNVSMNLPYETLKEISIGNLNMQCSIASADLIPSVNFDYQNAIAEHRLTATMQFVVYLVKK